LVVGGVVATTRGTVVAGLGAIVVAGTDGVVVVLCAAVVEVAEIGFGVTFAFFDVRAEMTTSTTITAAVIRNHRRRHTGGFVVLTGAGLAANAVVGTPVWGGYHLPSDASHQPGPPD
jgi:hypothetical protein